MGGYHWCTCPLALVYPPAPFLSAMSFASSAFIFSSFLDFWPNFHVAVWRPFRAPFSLNCICMESSGCLVSNSPSLVLFEARVVEISHLEGRWCKVENSEHLFLKNSYLSIQYWYCWALLVKLAKTLFFKTVQLLVPVLAQSV